MSRKINAKRKQRQEIIEKRKQREAIAQKEAQEMAITEALLQETENPSQDLTSAPTTKAEEGESPSSPVPSPPTAGSSSKATVLKTGSAKGKLKLPQTAPPSFSFLNVEKQFPEMDASQLNQYKMLAKMLFIAIFLGVAFTVIQFWRTDDNVVTSVLYIDINPSIALDLNRQEEVVEARALNSAGETMLIGLSLQEKSMEESLTEVMNYLNAEGFLQNSACVLLTVEAEDEKAGKALSIDANAYTEQLLLTLHAQVNTLGLWADPAMNFAQSAEEVGISMGKRVLCEELGTENFFFQLENLLPYSSGELYQLYATGEKNLPIGFDNAIEIATNSLLLSHYDEYSMEVKGDLLAQVPVYEILFQLEGGAYQVNVHGYQGELVSMIEREISMTRGITNQKAKELALTQAEKLELQVEQLIVTPKGTSGFLTYEVRFQEGEQQHSISILGKTGGILSHDISVIDPNEVSDLGQSSIQDLVFADAGVTRNQLSAIDFQRSLVDGVMVYIMTFTHENREYFYEIAGNGVIIQSYFQENEDTTVQKEISETEAKDVALAHAGVNFSQVTGLGVGYDAQGNFLIEFILERVPYAYCISRNTGEVLSYEKKEALAETTTNNSSTDSSTTTSSDDIGGEQAKRIAFAQDNLKEVMIQTVDLSFEGTGTEKKYKIAFEFGGFDYYYEVSASSGEIIHREKQAIQALLPPTVEAEPTSPELTQEEVLDEIYQNYENFNDLLLEFDQSFTGSSW